MRKKQQTTDNNIKLGTEIAYYRDLYRPQFHYSPRKGWMNDPNGMVYYEGEYHLFYQYTPHDTEPDFARMHWGHAISKDLVHWDELPPAIPPGEDGAIFSGSAVVDNNNTSGFFNEEGSGLVAIYTNDGNKTQPGKSQVQSIAYSKDKGRTWTKYEDNPVLYPIETPDFRDPKVIWHDESSMWIMVLAVRDRVEFYSSSNLKEWTYASDFGSDIPGIHRGVFECPDLIRMQVDEDPNTTKWILMLSIGDGNGVNLNDPEPPAGGSGMMYFIGNFDGKKFTTDETFESINNIKWVDYGSDFYAAVTWNGIPKEDGRKIWIGWMNNWRYAAKLPTEKWRGKTSIPRELHLKTYPEGLQLIQTPINEFSQLRKPLLSLQDLMINSRTNVLSNVISAQAEIIAEFEVGTAVEFGFKIRKSFKEETTIGYNTSNEELFIDRTMSSTTDFHSDFTAKHKVTMKPDYKRIQLSIYFDWSSVEVFGNKGEVVISDLIFPDGESKGLELYVIGGELRLISLEINDLSSVWGNDII